MYTKILFKIVLATDPLTLSSGQMYRETGASKEQMTTREAYSDHKKIEVDHLSSASLRRQLHTEQKHDATKKENDSKGFKNWSHFDIASSNSDHNNSNTDDNNVNKSYQHFSNNIGDNSNNVRSSNNGAGNHTNDSDDSDKENGESADPFGTTTTLLPREQQQNLHQPLTPMANDEIVVNSNTVNTQSDADDKAVIYLDDDSCDNSVKQPGVKGEGSVHSISLQTGDVKVRLFLFQF